MKHELTPQVEPRRRRRGIKILAVVGLVAAAGVIGATPASANSITTPANRSHLTFPFTLTGTYNPNLVAAAPEIRGRTFVSGDPSTVFCANTASGQPALDPVARTWSCLVDGNARAGFVNEQDWQRFKDGFAIAALVDTNAAAGHTYFMIPTSSTPVMSPVGEVLAGGLLAAGAAGFVVYGSRRRRAGASA